MGDWHGQGFTSDCVVPCGLRVFPGPQFSPASRHSVSFSEGKLQRGGNQLCSGEKQRCLPADACLP